MLCRIHYNYIWRIEFSVSQLISWLFFYSFFCDQILLQFLFLKSTPENVRHLIREGSTLICKICTFHAKWHHNSSSHFTQLLDSFVFFLKFFASSRGFKKRISFVCFNKCLVVCGWFCLFKIRYFSVIYTRSRNRPSSNTWRQSPRRCCWWSKIFFWWYPYCWSRLTPNYILHFGINVFDCIFLNYGCRMKHEIKRCQWQIW